MSSNLPDWVAPFCCVTPFLALMLFAAAALFGYSVGTFAILSLVGLCGKTTHWVLTATEA